MQDRDGRLFLDVRRRRLFPLIERVFADAGNQRAALTAAVAKSGAWTLGLSFELAEGLELNNSNRGAGYFERNGEGYVVRAGRRVKKMTEIADILVATLNGVPVRVKDVAQVRVGGELRTGSASTNCKEVVVGMALMLIGANSCTVSAVVDAKTAELRCSLPPNIELNTVLNRTLLVDATISTVAKNLAEGALLDILVLFLPLGNICAAIITALVIPLTMLLTFTGMAQGRITAHLMSLGALDYGLIVDGAVIITENSQLAGARDDIAVKVFGEEFEPIFAAANQIARILRGIKGAADVRVEQATGLPVLKIGIDKAAIARLGWSLSFVQDVIGAAIGGRDSGVVFEGDRRFRIVVQLPDTIRENVEALKNLPVSLQRLEAAANSSAIALRQVASFTSAEGPNQISRENGKRRVAANVRDRDIGSGVEEAKARIDREVNLPSGSWIAWGGQFANLAAARQRLMIVVPACFFAIFLLLYTAPVSPRDALFAFSAIPLALTGGVVALSLRDMPFSMSAAFGFIASSGLAVLNGLVMLVYVKQQLRYGRPFYNAVRDGAVTRLRPVVMTALVALLASFRWPLQREWAQKCKSRS